MNHPRSDKLGTPCHWLKAHLGCSGVRENAAKIKRPIWSSHETPLQADEESGRVRARHSGLGFASRQWWLLLFGTACLLLAPSKAWAHKPSDSYLTVRVAEARISGEWHLALRDLDYAIGLDRNDDGAITWEELRSQQQAVAAYALSRLQIRDADRAGRLQVTQLLVDHHSDGAYAVLRFVVEDLSPASGIEVQYQALFDLDQLHRGLLRFENQGVTRLAVFSPETPVQRFDLVSASPERSVLVFIKEGIWHIWTGYDHILFLIALLLPRVLLRQGGAWQPQRKARPVLAEVLKTVTAFTLAHSITLSLAALGVVHLPARLIESAIAVSVIFAAANNLLPLISERGWLVAFVFGLVHGFGFANALSDLGLGRGALATTLLSFNLGVEIGQLAIVSLFLPVALLWRDRPFYRCRLLPAGSVAIASVAAVWLIERISDAKWLPF